MAAIEVRKPRPGTPKDSREWEEYWNDLLERTGGVDDKVDESLTTAEAAQTTADAAQADATLSLAEVAALAVSTAAEVKTINFLRYWI